MIKREPILIGDLLRKLGVIREDNSVDCDLVAALFYYEQLSEERHQPIPDDLRRQLVDLHNPKITINHKLS